MPSDTRPATLDVPPPQIGRPLPVAASLFFIAGFAPLLSVFFVNLWSRPHYQFFPLALGGAAFLAWTRFKELDQPLAPGSRSAAWALFGTAFLILAVAAALWSPWLGVISALLALIATLWATGGLQLLRTMVPALLLLIAIVPPPLALDTRFAEKLRVLAVEGSSRLLDLLGVIHSRSGNIIELPGQKLLVEEACSGINSILVVMAGTLFYMLWRRRSALRIVLGLLAAVSFVLLGNLVRITLGAWLKSAHGIEILSGWRHELVGILLLVIYITLIFSLDNWLAFLLKPLPSRRSSSKPLPTPPNPLSPVKEVYSRRWFGLLGKHPDSPEQLRTPFSPQAIRGVAIAFALLGVASLGLGWKHRESDKAAAAIPKSALLSGATFTMPGHIGGWKRVSGDSPLLQKVETLGVYSQTWHYEKGDTLASIALDYPFAGYHDVTLCYTLRGWRLLQRQSARQSDFSFTQAQMQNEVGLYGDLWFSTVDERGQWIDKPALQLNLGEKFKLPGKTEPTTYRIQVLTTSYNPLSTPDQQQLTDFFTEARALLWKQLSAQMRTSQ